MPRFKLIPQPLSEEAEALLVRPPGVLEALGERFQLGGKPMLHNTTWPTCPGCGEAMTFYGQLDGLPKPSVFDLADAGLILVYVCFDCFDVTATFESA
jgi:hypothetical protein